MKKLSLLGFLLVFSLIIELKAQDLASEFTPSYEVYFASEIEGDLMEQSFPITLEVARLSDTQIEMVLKQLFL